MPRKLIIILTALVVLILPCCKKESQQNEIPVVAVSIAINPTSTEFIRLNTVGGYEYITGGYRGILVYRSGMYDFKAFERACPNDWNTNNTRLVVDPTGSMIICQTCKSNFTLNDGFVVSGPSKYPVKQYQTYFDGITLQIYN